MSHDDHGRRQQLVDATGDEDLLFADGYDEAIVGYAQRCGQPPIIVYDTEKALQCLVEQGMTYEEAEEWFSFNTAGAWVGDRTPMFLVRVDAG